MTKFFNKGNTSEKDPVARTGLFDLQSDGLAEFTRILKLITITSIKADGGFNKLQRGRAGRDKVQDDCGNIAATLGSLLKGNMLYKVAFSYTEKRLRVLSNKSAKQGKKAERRASVRIGENEKLAASDDEEMHDLSLNNEEETIEATDAASVETFNLETFTKDEKLEAAAFMKKYFGGPGKKELTPASVVKKLEDSHTADAVAAQAEAATAAAALVGGGSKTENESQGGGVKHKGPSKRHVSAADDVKHKDFFRYMFDQIFKDSGLFEFSAKLNTAKYSMDQIGLNAGGGSTDLLVGFMGDLFETMLSTIEHSKLLQDKSNEAARATTGNEQGDAVESIEAQLLEIYSANGLRSFHVAISKSDDKKLSESIIRELKTPGQLSSVIVKARENAKAKFHKALVKSATKINHLENKLASYEKKDGKEMSALHDQLNEAQEARRELEVKLAKSGVNLSSLLKSRAQTIAEAERSYDDTHQYKVIDRDKMIATQGETITTQDEEIIALKEKLVEFEKTNSSLATNATQSEAQSEVYKGQLHALAKQLNASVPHLKTGEKVKAGEVVITAVGCLIMLSAIVPMFSTIATASPLAAIIATLAVAVLGAVLTAVGGRMIDARAKSEAFMPYSNNRPLSIVAGANPLRDDDSSNKTKSSDGPDTSATH